nr:retrovirus-related Pol polyprotein from transposon TNT 1-94 [Tanacetum cinerariifolium]
MITEPGDTNREVPMNETFHVQTDDELTEKEPKQIEADDQAIQNILLGLPEDIYAAEKKAKLFNEWERFTSNERESIESYYHRFLKFMNDLKRNIHFPEKIAINLKFLNNLQPEWSRHEVDELKAERVAKTQDPLALMANSNNPYAFLAPHQDQPSFNQNYMQQPIPNPEDIIDPTTAMNMALVLMAKAFKINYSTTTIGFHQTHAIGRLLNRNGLIGVRGNANLNGNRNLVVARAEGNTAGHNGNQIRCYNCRGVGHFARNCTVKPRKRDAAYLQTQLLIAQKEEAGIQLHVEEFDLMAAAADLNEIEEVNANCILMANLQQASTLGTQTEKAPVYDSDGSAEYTELLEPIPEPHQIPQNDNNVIFEVTSVEQSRGTVEQHPENVEETRALYDSLYQNLAIEVEKVNSINRKLKETNTDLTTELARFKIKKSVLKLVKKNMTNLKDVVNNLNKQLSKQKSTVSFLLEEKKKLTSDFKTREVELLDKQIQLEKKIKKLNNILVKTGQSIQTIHMLSSKPDSFYHTEQKMTLGYQNPFYLNQAQKKQQSLYYGKVLLEKHDPPVVHDSEETLQLAQESREKMKQLNKEIKPSNYTKIDHLLGVFVSQSTKSCEELYFLNDSKTANVSKSISIPNEEFSDATTLSVARNFLNKVKSTIVTLQRVVKHRMTLETHNWSSSAHQELYKILKDENFPIVNQVDARVQNFEIQFLKEAAKFVGDFKSLAKEADESLAKHKALELEIKRLLRAVVNEDIMSVCDECKYDKISYDKAYKDMQQKIELLQAHLGDLKGKSKDTLCVSETLNPLSQKHENEKMELEFQQESKVVKNDKVIAPGMFRINPFKTSREENHVSNNNSRGNKQMANVSFKQKQKNRKPKVKKPKKVWFIKRLTTPKPSKPRSFLRWSSTGRMFDLNGKIIASSESESQFDCSKGDNACCSKHMTGNLKLLINFIWKFLGTVPFGNDHVAAILGFGDLQWGNILITRVYFVEGLGNNLFSVGKFCDLDLEVAFRRNACFVRNLERVDLLKGDRLTNIYTINLHEMSSASPICLMARASSTKSWLRHQRLSHLNFDTINDLARNDLVLGLPKFKYNKEHLCPSCEQGKRKRASHPPKPVPNSRQRLHLLHMDLCGPMRIASINGKRYVLVIMHVLKEYFDSIGISHQMSSVRTPQQNGVVERRNRTLVEAARTMLIFSRAPLFLWDEAIATVCFTQNRSIIHRRFNKTPYELINTRKPNISFLHVFGALCYPKNDREDIGKLGAKGDIGFFIGYSADSCAYINYNQRTKKIMETMNVSFDELLAMDFEQHSSKPGLQSMTSGQISSGLDLTYAPSTISTQLPTEGELDLLF